MSVIVRRVVLVVLTVQFATLASPSAIVLLALCHVPAIVLIGVLLAVR